jgi:hypothetical protein
MTERTSAAIEQLVSAIAEELAPRIAEEVARRFDPPRQNGGLGTETLITLDQLVEQLPPAKSPATWKSWLYERLRRGEVPVDVAVKLGGLWFFYVEPTRSWIQAGAPSAGART